jgi:hypothetical protein
MDIILMLGGAQEAISNGQSGDTGNIGHIKQYRTNMNKAKQKITDPIKTHGVNPGARKG